VDLTIWLPFHSFETEDLKRRCGRTSGITNAILGPPDHLAWIVNTNRDGIASPRKTAKRRQFAIPPNGSPTLKVSAKTAKIFTIWISLGSLGHDRRLAEQIWAVGGAV
jgi:hypothetical protein